MILNTAEQEIWNEHKDFFAPNNNADEVAYAAYLGKYAQISAYESRSGLAQQQLIGVLLKQAPDEAVTNAFTLYYKQFRTGSNSVEFDAWLGDFSAHRSEILSYCLKKAAPDLNFTQQFMVLRDVGKWLPGSNIKEYAPIKLLKTKPNVILKQFNPALIDIPYLLVMSASLMKNEDAQSQALGDTIARGSFIARYGMPTDPTDRYSENSYQRATVKYCSIEAFSMLVQHGIRIEPSVLLQAVQLRYNAQSVVFDALAYPAMVLNDETASTEATDYALAVLNDVMLYAENSPSHAGFGTVVEQALASIYGALGSRVPAMSQRIETVLEMHIRLLIQEGYHSNRTYDNVLSAVASAPRKGPELLVPLAKRILDSSPDEIAFLHTVTLNIGVDMYNTMSYEPRVRNAFFGLLAPTDIEKYLLGGLQTFFGVANDSKKRTQELKNLFQNLSRYNWSDEQKNAFKHSPLAATTILLYLYMAASGHAENPESTYQHGVPFTQWEPMPFLKKMYPESMPLWNQMTIGLLQMPMSKNSDESRFQYQRVMGSMFQAFSQTFLDGDLSLAAAQGVVESLDANPLDYFLNINKKMAPIMRLELPQDMFSFS